MSLIGGDLIWLPRSPDLGTPELILCCSLRFRLSECIRKQGINLDQTIFET